MRLGAFTLVELLVVITIIGVLVALLLPAIQAAREAARRSTCVNNLKQFGIAMQAFHAANKRFPAGGEMHKTNTQFGRTVGWRVYLLPYLEQTALYERISVTGNGKPSNWNIGKQLVSGFNCPSVESKGASGAAFQLSNYWGVAGASRIEDRIDLEDSDCGDLYTNGVLYPGSDIQIGMITDGTSNTLAVGERVYVFTAWMSGTFWIGSPPGMICSEAANNIVYPINGDPNVHGYYTSDSQAPLGSKRIPLNHLYFGSFHPGGAHFAYADGSVHFLPEEIDFTILEDLATIAGGEINRLDP